MLRKMAIFLFMSFSYLQWRILRPILCSVMFTFMMLLLTFYDYLIGMPDMLMRVGESKNLGVITINYH